MLINLRLSALCRLWVLLACMTIVPPAAAEAQSSDILPFKATERTLANGLKVIVVPTGFPNLVSIDIPVQVGSRNEIEPGKSGFAHFFEHLMFRGTPNTPPEKMRALMTRAGARDNAGTGDDRTHYFATFAKEYLEPVLALYADMFQHLAYSETDFRTEARAVLGEYNKNSADPLRKLFEVQRDRFFKTHTYKHTTMGFVADIENMPNQYEYSKVFFDRWYRPQYTTVIVAGDVTPEQVLPIVEKYWGGWAGGGGARPAIPQEPAHDAPLYAHVSWPASTLPWVTVAYGGPPFDEKATDTAALSLIANVYFGQTSEVYKELVVRDQKVDQLLVDEPANVDASLFTVLARVKNPADAVYVRDRLLRAFDEARSAPMPARDLSDAKSYMRYSFARTLDSTEWITAVVSSYAMFRRSYATVNEYYRTLDTVEPADLQAAARKYFIANNLIVTALSKDPLPAGMERLAAETATAADAIIQKSALPLLNIKLLFTVGSSHDPAGKEGLAALTAAMLSRGGSRAMTIEEIDRALYPVAGSFAADADKEMTVFTARIHRDHWSSFLKTALPQLLDPGFRPDDFARLKDAQMNALVLDLRSNNEEELGRERLQTNLFRGTPYGHVALGTVAGVNAIALDDVRRFAKAMYTRANLRLGINGDAPPELMAALTSALSALPQGPAVARASVEVRRAPGMSVDIIEKDTRATAISFGFPIDVTRSHPDFAALSIARSWLGEHRMTSGRLFQRIREIRGMNYGDYAYIEAFPRGMFRFFPDPNIARQRQIFEIWIRPVVPAQAHMALRIAMYELDALIRNGLTEADVESTRQYLLNNVYVMTSRQDQQLGYALDSAWYGTGEFTSFMRQALQAATRDQVNAAIRRHLTARDLSVVMIAKDAAGLKQALAADVPSPIAYDGERPAEVLAEDRTIAALKLNIPADRITITPVAEVFAK